MRRLSAGIFLLLVALGCSRQEAGQTASNVADSARSAAQNIREQFTGEGPTGPRVTREEIERERFNANWQKLRSFQAAQRRREAVAARRQQAQTRLTFVQETQFSEKLDQASLQTIETAPIHVPIRGDVAGPSVLRIQVLLDRVMFSPGVIDGRWGKNTAIAVYWFQRENGLETTGEVDEATFREILARGNDASPVVDYTLTAEDVAGPFTKIPDDVYEQEKLECLCYESLAEKLAEKFHTTPELNALLNPGVDLNNAQAGQRIRALNVRPPSGEGNPPDLSKLIVSVEGNYLHGVDASGLTLFHAPTTVGSKYDPSPSESVKIVGIARNPHFHYQPKLFHEVPDTDPEANLQPGPNSPVGVVWMALSKPHYGMHGTSDPDSIGYASSHGCVRLTNWDAHDVSYRVQTGTVVEFVDARGGRSD